MFLKNKQANGHFDTFFVATYLVTGSWNRQLKMLLIMQVHRISRFNAVFYKHTNARLVNEGEP